MQATREFKEDRTIFGNQKVSRRSISHGENLHIPRAGCVTDIDRIGQDHSTDPALGHFTANAPQPIQANLCQVDAFAFGGTVQQRDTRKVAALCMPVKICHCDLQSPSCALEIQILAVVCKIPNNQNFAQPEVMKNYRHSLPPLDSLIFFEAAARHLNFSDAAEELLVTQTAVSKRIRQLEDHLGVALFIRSGRMIDLTDEGRKLAEQSSILLDFANNALASVATRPDAPVRIAANNAVSLFWLAPRLKNFGLSDQACSVEMVSSDQPDALQDTQNDIVILHGIGSWKGASSSTAVPGSSGADHIFPTCRTTCPASWSATFSNRVRHTPTLAELP